MKTNKLVTLALPFMLLTGVVGCSNDKAEEKKSDSLKVSEEKKTDTSKTSKKVDNSKLQVEKEYKSNLNSLMGEFTKQAVELNEILASDKNRIEKRNEFDTKSDIFQKTADKIIALDPGEKYKEVHSIIKDAMLSSKQGSLLINSGINLKDDKMIHDGGETMTKASQQLAEADKKLKEMK
ncbi:hypothetical protein [Bacillus sp. BP-3]|uniref:hypothetical protein n=1 Tax=Bacillus sp. BP-3 TaxID=3022773 RepID=UPI00232D7474|nr:hypothetical protein [Bacillus sp. BP-3]MDC2864385.1 hypothetical protein [Bacillus sp. BP-3]